MLQLGFHPVAVVVDLYKYRKETAQKRNNKQNDTKTQNTQNRKHKKQEKIYQKNIKNHKFSN